MDTMRICSYLWTVFIVVWLMAAFRTKRAQQRMVLGRGCFIAFRFLWAVIFCSATASLGGCRNALFQKVFGLSPWQFC